MIDLVILDCDGVLVDSEPISNRILTGMLGEIGLPMSVEETTREFVGRSMEDCWRIIEQRLGRTVPDGFAARYDRLLLEAFRKELRPVRDVAEALERIPRPLCVASSGSREKIRASLGLTGLLPRFENRIFSAVEVKQGKPAPDLFLHAARRMGADAERCVVIEDSPRGVRAGVAAGMTVLGYAERSAAAELGAEGARCFEQMRQLPELLEVVAGGANG